MKISILMLIFSNILYNFFTTFNFKVMAAINEEVTPTPNTGDLDYDKLVKEAETLEANTPPTSTGYDTDVDNFATQQ